MRQSVRAIIVNDGKMVVMNRNKFGYEYTSLIGGGIDPGETPEVALRREVKEETGMDVGNIKLVANEDAGQIYGMQYIFLCEYIGGDPALSVDAEEAKINALGQNLYMPAWLDILDLDLANFLPKELKDQLIVWLKDGFPDEPIELVANI